MPEDEMSEDEQWIGNVKKYLASLKKRHGEYTTAIPLADFYEEPKRIEWLRTQGLEIPLQRPDGRNPTPQELRNILKREFFCVSYNMPLGGQWTATVRYRKQGDTIYRLLEVFGRDYIHEDKPITLGLSGNHDLMKLFMEKLAALCGPFVLIMDGEHPEIFGLGSHQPSEDET